MRSIISVMTVVIVLALCGSTQAMSLVFTFDFDQQGWQNAAWVGLGPTPSGDPCIQATLTAGAWQMGSPQYGFPWDHGQQEMQVMAQTGVGHLSFDAMYDGASFPAGVAGWYQLNMVSNSDGAAQWTQTEHLVDSWHNADDSTLFTHHFDFSFAQLGWEPGDTWFQFLLGANSDAAFPVNVYVDNVVLTPEPVTMALLGLGGLVVMRRRPRA